MKIKIWKVIQDNGDGSSSARMFRNAQEIIDEYNLPEDQWEELQDGGCPFEPDYEVPLQIDVTIFDTDGYEVVG